MPEFSSHDDLSDSRQMGGAAGTVRDKGPISRASITSFIFGILGFIPIVTGLAAIAIGWLALRALRSSEARGRRLALAGITLGIISILAWTGAGLNWWIQTSPQKIVVGSFMEELADGDVRAAKEKTIGIADSELDRFSTQFKRWGGTPSMFIMPTIPHWNGGKLQGTCEVTANFAVMERKVLDLDMVQQNGQWKITSIKMTN